MTKASVHFPVGAPINGVRWLGGKCAAAGGDGCLHLALGGGEKAVNVKVSDAPLLGLIETPEGFVTSDESGNVHLITVEGEVRLLAATKSMFLEHLAWWAKGRKVLAATGKTVTMISMDGTMTPLPHKVPSTIGGMAVSPIGPRVAVGHYGGATVLALDNVKNPPRELPWKGSHLGLTYSPDGKWLISGMQEQAIHLWRMNDGMDLQMRGYPGKITQFSWASDGVTLGTNGGGGVPLWDFATTKGPAGTQARVLADSGTQEVLVSALAMHPKGPFCMVGYTDGLVLLVNTDQDRAVLLHEPKQAAVEHCAWTDDGMFVAVAVGDELVVTDFGQLV